MKRRADVVSIASGVAIVGVYVVLAFVSGRGSVLARRPLLDGFSPPPPYKWVNPPADVAPTNKQPSPATQKVPLGPPRRGAGVFSDTDAIMTLIIEPASFPSSAGAGIAKLKSEPLDPASLGAPPPAGMVLDGNAYRLSLTLASGKQAPAFLNPAHFVLQYPQPPAEFFSSEKHTILLLSGQAWAPLKSTDSPAAQQATADVTTLGTFVVGATRPPPKAKPKSNPALFIGLGVAAVAILVGLRVVLGIKSRPGRGGSRNKRKAPPAKPKKKR